MHLLQMEVCTRIIQQLYNTTSSEHLPKSFSALDLNKEKVSHPGTYEGIFLLSFKEISEVGL